MAVRRTNHAAAIYGAPPGADGELSRRAMAHLRRDAVLRRIIKQVGPCTLAPRRQYFAALCEAIVSQQLAIRAAETIFRRYCDLFPRRRPAPAALMEIGDDALRSAGLSAQKIRYLRDLAARFLDGTVPQRRLARMSDDEVIESLTKVKGIGVWTVQMFLIFVLNRADVWPVEDLGVRRAVQIQFALAELPNQSEMTALAEPWRPYRSIAAWYLWQSLQNKPMA